LDDYACFINSLVSLYEASFDERYIDAAVEMADQMLAHFADREGEGFFYSPDDGEKLLTRQKDLQDSATPSGNSMAATALVRLGKLTGRTDYVDAAVGAMRAAVGLMQRYPSAAGQMLIALDWHLGPTYEIAILGQSHDDQTKQVIDDLQKRYLPNKLVAFRAEPTARAPANSGRGEEPPGGARSAALDPLFAGKVTVGAAGPVAYICQDFACQAPLVGAEQISAEWKRLTTAPQTQD
jgi:uncharacterized protein YyaL (SSP411 family)